MLEWANQTYMETPGQSLRQAEDENPAHCGYLLTVMELKRTMSNIRRDGPSRRLAVALLLLATTSGALAHDADANTHEFTAPARDGGARWLSLSVVDDESGRQLAAGFQLEIDGSRFTPEAIGPRGLRLVVRHHKKDQRAVGMYVRGTGTAVVPLPDGATGGAILVSHGYEYLAARTPFVVEGQQTRLTIRLRRWIDLQARGWYGADAHLHFDRLDPEYDSDWLDILDADGLDHAYFLTLKGGNLPGMWAQQYAHGPEGEAVAEAGGWIRPGTEYRDRMQGHVTLLGPAELIEPVSTGGLGEPPVEENFPTLHDVMIQARSLGGLSGIAHGNVLGRQPTGLLDAVLGAADFIEIANTHRLELEAWYLLLNCGIVLPPAAGTDLPNNPYRDAWQPLLGETRMYVRSSEPPSFDSWKEAVRSGAVVVSSGPWLELEVSGTGPGGTVRLPKGGGEVRVTGLVQSPRAPHALEIVHDGRVIETRTERRRERGIYQWRTSSLLRVERSGWVAARASGVEKQELRESTGIRQREAAHTAAVRVLVGDEPIHSEDSVRRVVARLQKLRKAYQRQGTYARPEDRNRALRLFDRAIEGLQTEM